jgi:predicted transcriptional regulator
MARVDPDLFDEMDSDADEDAVCEGEADADAGRVVSNDAFSKWLDTWGTTEEGPPPDAWFR